MKKCNLLILSLAAFAATQFATAVAQERPQRPRAAWPQIAEADDAPPPAVQVFEVQAIQLAAPIARPAIAPAPFPTEPPRAVAPDGTLVPSSESEAVDRVRVQLADSSQLVGEIAADTPLMVKANFGEVAIKFEDVARIDVAVDDGHWRVTLTSGDRVTGELKLSGIELTTSWGAVKLDEKTIAAIEAGKLHTQQFAVARTSPDGRTTSVAYRQRQVFAPLLPEGGNGDNTGYQPTGPYGVPTYPTPAFSAPSVAIPAPAIPRPR